MDVKCYIPFFILSLCGCDSIVPDEVRVRPIYSWGEIDTAFDGFPDAGASADNWSAGLGLDIIYRLKPTIYKMTDDQFNASQARLEALVAVIEERRVVEIENREPLKIVQYSPGTGSHSHDPAAPIVINEDNSTTIGDVVDMGAKLGDSAAGWDLSTKLLVGFIVLAGVVAILYSRRMAIKLKELDKDK